MFAAAAEAEAALDVADAAAEVALVAADELKLLDEDEEELLVDV